MYQKRQVNSQVQIRMLAMTRSPFASAQWLLCHARAPLASLSTMLFISPCTRRVLKCRDVVVGSARSTSDARNTAKVSPEFASAGHECQLLRGAVKEPGLRPRPMTPWSERKMDSIGKGRRVEYVARKRAPLILEGGPKPLICLSYGPMTPC